MHYFIEWIVYSRHNTCLSHFNDDVGPVVRSRIYQWQAVLCHTNGQVLLILAVSSIEVIAGVCSINKSDQVFFYRTDDLYYQARMQEYQQE